MHAIDTELTWLSRLTPALDRDDACLASGSVTVAATVFTTRTPELGAGSTAGAFSAAIGATTDEEGGGSSTLWEVDCGPEALELLENYSLISLTPMIKQVCSSIIPLFAEQLSQ
jgi:hypothetical protein